MFLICIDKRTGKVIPDFQSNPSPGTLIDNAVKAGTGNVEDFEEREVSQVEYDQHVADYKAKFAAQVAQEEQQRKQLEQSLVNKLKGIGLMAEEIRILRGR